MDKLFVELYKRVNMDATNEQIDMRMRSIKNILNDINEEMIEGIVKVFAKTPVSEEFYNQFGNYFYEEDYSFDLDNKEELSILAGYISHQLLEDEEWREKVAILIVLLSITNNENRYSQLFQEAFASLENMMCATREEKKELKTKNLKTIDIKTLKNSFEGEGTFSVDNVELLYSILNILDENIRTVKEQNKNLQNEIKKYREESQILNWVIGEWCNWKNISLKYIEEKEIILLLGRELAGFVNIYPGPFAAKAFLAKMLSKTKNYTNNEYSLAEIVNSLSAEDRDTMVSEFEKYDLSNYPIMMALSASQKVEGIEEWYPIYKKEMGLLPNDIKKNCIEWAYQFYLENIAKMVM